ARPLAILCQAAAALPGDHSGWHAQAERRCAAPAAHTVRGTGARRTSRKVAARAERRAGAGAVVSLRGCELRCASADCRGLGNLRTFPALLCGHRVLAG